jgi:dynein light chain roadblock-type
MSTEVEETLERIKGHKGVEGVIIVNSDGVPIRPSKGNMDEKTTQKYAANIAQLTTKARSVVRDLDPQNDLTFLRIRSKKHEIMVAPDKDFLLIIIQDPTVSNKK